MTPKSISPAPNRVKGVGEGQLALQRRAASGSGVAFGLGLAQRSFPPLPRAVAGVEVARQRIET